jgi:hypothetical protein
MKSISKSTLFVCSIFFSVIIFSGCKEKGCTNPQAINYNSVADEDDGSCILCKGTTDTLTETTCNLYDNNFQSPFYGQIVGVFHVTQVKDNYPYAECGTNACRISVGFENLVNKTMILQYSLQCSGSIGISFSFQKTTTAPAQQTTEQGFIPTGNIFNPCLPIVESALFCSTFGNITYIN